MNRLTPFGFLLPCVVGAVACAHEHDEVDPNAAKTQYEVSCEGEVVKASSVDTRLRPQHDDHGAVSCDAPDAEITFVPPGTKCGTNVYLWDGKECKEYATSSSEGAMHCAGADCVRITRSLADCQADHVDCPK